VTVDSQQVAATDIETRPWSWLAYRHGLRASEVCDLQWHQVELDHGRRHVRRAKNGTPSVHPIRSDEIRRESPTQAYVSVTERGGPMSTIGFHHHIQRLGKAAQRQFYQRGIRRY
jgi:integrase